MAMDFDESGERTFANNIPKKRVLSIQSHVVSGCKSIICGKIDRNENEEINNISNVVVVFLCAHFPNFVSYFMLTILCM